MGAIAKIFEVLMRSEALRSALEAVIVPICIRVVLFLVDRGALNPKLQKELDEATVDFKLAKKDNEKYDALSKLWDIERNL